MSKDKKSKFKRKNMDRYSRVNYSWRKPTGHGRPKKLGDMPKVGHRTEKKVRGLHPSGYEDKLVHNTNDLEDIDNEKVAVRIASGVGRKKRIQILKESLSRDIKVLNVTNPQEYIEEGKPGEESESEEEEESSKEKSEKDEEPEEEKEAEEESEEPEEEEPEEESEEGTEEEPEEEPEEEEEVEGEEVEEEAEEEVEEPEEGNESKESKGDDE